MRPQTAHQPKASAQVQSNTITGYQGGRWKRVTDKFVRYPYPKTMGSGYSKDFKEKLKSTIVLKNGEAFNLEKESKIINPHKMDLGTTNGAAYKSFEVKPKKKLVKGFKDEGKPILAQSSYQNAYPNWRNGQNDVFHEKHPQYPFYSLPFKGQTSYQQNFTEEQQKRLREHNRMLNQIGKTGTSSNIIALKQYKPYIFDSETTN